MPYQVYSDTSLSDGLTKLGESLFGGYENQLRDAYYAQQAFQTKQETEDLMRAAAAREGLGGLFTDPNADLSDPNTQRQIFGHGAMLGDEYLTGLPGYLASGAAMTTPGMTPEATANMLVSGGVQTAQNTMYGMERGLLSNLEIERLKQDAETARNNGDNETAVRLQAMADAASMERLQWEVGNTPVTMTGDELMLTPEGGTLAQGPMYGTVTMPGDEVLVGPGGDIMAQGPTASIIMPGENEIAYDIGAPVSEDGTLPPLAYGGGAAPGSGDPALTGLGATGGPYTGTGVDAETQNIILNANEILSSGGQLSPQDMQVYESALIKAYAPVTTATRDPQTNQWIEQRVQPPIPPSLFIPESVKTLLGVTTTTPTPAPAATTTGSTTAPAPTLDTANMTDEQLMQALLAPQQGTTPAVTPDTPGGTPGSMTGPVSTGAVTLTPLTDPRPAASNLTGEETRRITLEGRFYDAVNDMFRLYGFDPATGQLDPKGYRPGLRAGVANIMSNQGSAGVLAANVVRSEDDQMAADATFFAITPLLRLDSGAATPEQEVARYEMYAPQFGIGEANVQYRLQYLSNIAASVQQLAAAKGISFDALMAQVNSLPPDDPRIDELHRELEQFRQ